MRAGKSEPRRRYVLLGVCRPFCCSTPASHCTVLKRPAARFLRSPLAEGCRVSSRSSLLLSPLCCSSSVFTLRGRGGGRWLHIAVGRSARPILRFTPSRGGRLSAHLLRRGGAGWFSFGADLSPSRTGENGHCWSSSRGGGGVVSYSTLSVLPRPALLCLAGSSQALHGVASNVGGLRLTRTFI